MIARREISSAEIKEQQTFDKRKFLIWARNFTIALLGYYDLAAALRFFSGNQSEQPAVISKINTPKISTPWNQSCEFIVTGRNLGEETITRAVNANKRTAISNEQNEDTLSTRQVLAANQADFEIINDRGFFAIPYPADDQTSCAQPVEGNAAHTPPKDFLRSLQGDEQLWVTTNFSPNIPITPGTTVRYLVTNEQGHVQAFPEGKIVSVNQKDRILRLKTNQGEVFVPVRAIFVEYRSTINKE